MVVLSQQSVQLITIIKYNVKNKKYSVRELCTHLQ